MNPWEHVEAEKNLRAPSEQPVKAQHYAEAYPDVWCPQFFRWLCSPNVRSFRILPRISGDLYTVRWSSVLEPETAPEYITHLSLQSDDLAFLLASIPEQEDKTRNGEERANAVYKTRGNPHS